MRLATYILTTFVLLSSCRVDNDDLYLDVPKRSGEAEGRAIGESEPLIPIFIELDQDGEASEFAVSYTMQVEETSMRSSYNLDTENLSYRFRYLSFDQSETIKFEDGKASIRLSGLPTNQTGSVIMEILEGEIVKLQAKEDDVTLNPGRNSLKLHMKAVEQEQDEQDNNQNESVTSFADVRSIFTNNCVRCHGSQAQGGLNLSNYPFQSNMLSGQQAIVSRILETISGASPSMPPPPAQKLSAGDVEKIKKWQSDGLKN